MPLNGIQCHHLQSPPRQTREVLRHGRGAVTLHCAYEWSSILPATKPKLPPDLFICGKFTADRPQRNAPAPAGSQHQDSSRCGVPCHGEGNAPAPQAVCPLASVLPLPLFHCSIGGNSAPSIALPPLGFVCSLPRLCGIRYIFRTLRSGQRTV